MIPSKKKPKAKVLMPFVSPGGASWRWLIHFLFPCNLCFFKSTFWKLGYMKYTNHFRCAVWWVLTNALWMEVRMAPVLPGEPPMDWRPRRKGSLRSSQPWWGLNSDLSWSWPRPPERLHKVPETQDTHRTPTLNDCDSRSLTDTPFLLLSVSLNSCRATLWLSAPVSLLRFLGRQQTPMKPAP